MRDALTSTVIVALGAMWLPPTAYAQGRPLSLAEAQAEARAHAPEKAELDALVRSAEAIAAQAGRRLRADPTVSSSYFQGAWTGRPDESAWRVGVKQPVDFSGSWMPRAASAASDVERTRQDRESGLKALDERVAVASADVALAQRQLARSERIADLHRVATDAVRRQFDVGQAPQIDVDSAELELASALASVEQRRGDLDGGRVRLGRLLGRDAAGDLVVEDPPEAPDVSTSAPDFSALVDRDPRVRAAMAESDAAEFERQMIERLMTPSWALGADFGRQRRDIPLGSFAGAPPGGLLTANWTDWELVFNASVDLPLFNRQRGPRARVTGRLLAAEARLRTARADVLSELRSSWSTLRAAARTLESLASTGAIIDRDVTFVEQAVAAGAFDALTRTTELRRLQEAGRHVDTAVREVRAARAAWIRRASGLP